MRCYACGLVNCSCGCGGDPELCSCSYRYGRYRHNPFEVCPVCGVADCPCGCEDDPNLCTCARRDEKDIAKDMQAEGYTLIIIDSIGQLQPYYAKDDAEAFEYIKSHTGRSFKAYDIDEFQYQEVRRRYRNNPVVYPSALARQVCEAIARSSGTPAGIRTAIGRSLGYAPLSRPNW